MTIASQLTRAVGYISPLPHHPRCIGEPTNTAALRGLIRQAHFNEAYHGHLADLIVSRPLCLHHIIRPQGKNTGDIPTRSIHVYVRQMPDLFDAANDVTREAGIEERIKPVLKVAEQFLFTPPALPVDHDGLDALLDEAYLTHRLVEEVSDRYIAHSGQALIPLGTTIANLMAYQLVSEPFANRLDEVIHHAVESTLNATTFDIDSARICCENLKNPRVAAA